MARATPALFSSISGTLGGIECAVTGGTQILRARKLRVASPTPAERNNQLLTGWKWALWASLTDAQRTAWATAASQTLRRTRSNTSRPWTPTQAFFHCIPPLRNIDISPYLAAPSSGQIAGPARTVCEFKLSGSFELQEWYNGSMAQTIIRLMQVRGPMTPASPRTNQRWIHLGRPTRDSVIVLIIGPWVVPYSNFKTAIMDALPGLQPGDRISLRLKYYSPATWPTTWLETQTTVQA